MTIVPVIFSLLDGCHLTHLVVHATCGGLSNAYLIKSATISLCSLFFLLLSEASVIFILQSGGGNGYGACSGYSSSRSGSTG